jgi:DNA-binding transcriptional regulator LsrR (DeoR family)
MNPRAGQGAKRVVQAIGGVGNAASQIHATRLTDRLAMLTGAEAVPLPAPGLAGSAATRAALVSDRHVREIMRGYHDVTMVLAGVGSLEPSPLLRQSGNAIEESDQALLRKRGAVGDVCLRFFDVEGAFVHSPLDERVIGIDVDTLRAVPRVVGVAGGTRKHRAIRGALRGKWLNVLITDVRTARFLVAD